MTMPMFIVMCVLNLANILICFFCW